VTQDPADPVGPVIRDKRRFDPQTGARREPEAATAAHPSRDIAGAAGSGIPLDPEGAGGGPPTDHSGGPELSAAEVALAERTADMQRLQAEYLNYKRRVDRDREVARDAAKVAVLSALLPVLDDIGRAREHGELTGGFKAVAESLERSITNLGLVPFGEVGDDFDPHRHEALLHSYSDEVSGPVCQAILQVGYQFGERVVRPARVAVAEPTEARSAELAAAGAATPDAAAASEQSSSAEAASGEPAGAEASGADADILADAEVASDDTDSDQLGSEQLSESSGAAGHSAQTS